MKLLPMNLCCLSAEIQLWSDHSELFSRYSFLRGERISSQKRGSVPILGLLNTCGNAKKRDPLLTYLQIFIGFPYSKCKLVRVLSRLIAQLIIHVRNAGLDERVNACRCVLQHVESQSAYIALAAETTSPNWKVESS